MKKIGLGLLVFLLTGCSNSQLVCTISSENGEFKQDTQIIYRFDGAGVATGYEGITTFTMLETATLTKENMRDILANEEIFSTKEIISSIKITDTGVESNIKVVFKKLDKDSSLTARILENKKTKKEIKETALEIGADCK